MKIIELQGDQMIYYADFWALYQESFPVHEKRSAENQLKLFADPRYHVDFYIENGSLAAFMAYWNFSDVVYIEHYAVEPSLRGCGYGSKVLKDFLDKTSKNIVLEIDPVEDEISLRRLRFYKALGFVENPYKHVQPAYVKGYEGFVLTVLSYPQMLNHEKYEYFYRELCDAFPKL